MKPDAIHSAATLLVLEILPGHCPQWRQQQIFHEVTTLVGSSMNPLLIKRLRSAIRYRGEHEAEVEAVERVLSAFTARNLRRRRKERC